MTTRSEAAGTTRRRSSRAASDRWATSSCWCRSYRAAWPISGATTTTRRCRGTGPFYWRDSGPTFTWNGPYFLVSGVTGRWDMAEVSRIGALLQTLDPKPPLSPGEKEVVKNKLAPPFREAEFDILDGVGISRPHELIDLCAERGIIGKSGAWFDIAGERVGPGPERAAEVLRQNEKLALELEPRRSRCPGYSVRKSCTAPMAWVT